jgi:hypothetical protein
MNLPQSFADLTPVIAELIDKPGLCLWCTDHEQFLSYEVFGAFRAGPQVGDSLKPDSTAAIAAKGGRKVSRYVPADVYGSACRTIALPVGGHVYGLSYSIATEDAVKHSIQDLYSRLDSISGHVQKLAADVAETAGFVREFVDPFVQTKGHIDGITSVTRTIHKIADRSKLISINARIEAARAGDAGRTFAIVAQEVQKLADETAAATSSVKAGSDQLQGLFDVIEAFVRRMESTLATQSAATSAIASRLVESAESLAEIEGLAAKL